MKKTTYFRANLPAYANIKGHAKEGVVKVLGYTGVYNYVKVERKDGIQLTVPDVLLETSTKTFTKAFRGKSKKVL